MSSILKRFKPTKSKAEATSSPPTLLPTPGEPTTEGWDPLEAAGSIFTGLTLTTGAETAPHLEKSSRDDQTFESESGIAEQITEPSGCFVPPVTLSDTSRAKQSIDPLPVVSDYTCDCTSGSGFNFLGTAIKPESNEQNLDDAFDKDKFEVEQPGVEALCREGTPEVCYPLILSSPKAKEVEDKPVGKEMSSSNVPPNDQVFGTLLTTTPTSSSSGSGDKAAASVVSTPKQQQITKQYIPTSAKKKKRKGIHPGHKNIELTSSEPFHEPDVTRYADADSLSLNSQDSSSGATSTMHSFVNESEHLASGSQSGEESSSIEKSAKSKHFDTDVIDDANTPNVPKSPIDEGCKQTSLELRVANVSMATIEKGNDAACRPSSSTTMEVTTLVVQTAKELEDDNALSVHKVLKVNESSSSNPTPAITNYQIELSPADKLTLLLESVQSKQDQLRLSLGVVRSEYEAKIDEQLGKIQRQIEIHNHVKELRRKETAALDEENYDLAAELTKELEGAELQEEWSLATNCHGILVEAVQQYRELYSEELSDQENHCIQLRELKDEQAELLSALEKDLTSLNTREKMQLQSMEDKISRERGHISLDKEHLEKRTQVLQDEINHRATDFISSKSELEERKRDVEAQIVELSAKLHHLQSTSRELDECIAMENKRIHAVHEDFAIEENQIEKEKEAIEEKVFSVQQDEETLERCKESYQESLLEYEEKRKSIQRVIDTSSEKLAETSDTLVSLREVPDFIQNWLASDLSELLLPSSQLQRMKQSEASLDIRIKDATAEVMAIQSELFSLQKRIDDAETRRVQLLETKKVAAAARQFHEAGRIVKEEKSVSVSLQEMRKSEEELSMVLKEKHKALDGLTAEMMSNRKDKVELELKEDFACVQEILNITQNLKKQCSSIPNKLVDMLPVLQKWCSFHEQLVEELCVKHNIVVSDVLANKDPMIFNKEELADEYKQTSTDAMDESNPEHEKGLKNGQKCEEDKETNQLLMLKMSEIESKIEQACEEENYDLAAELDEELNQLKSRMGDTF